MILFSLPFWLLGAWFGIASVTGLAATFARVMFANTAHVDRRSSVRGDLALLLVAGQCLFAAIWLCS